MWASNMLCKARTLPPATCWRYTIRLRRNESLAAAGSTMGSIASKPSTCVHDHTSFSLSDRSVHGCYRRLAFPAIRHNASSILAEKKRRVDLASAYSGGKCSRVAGHELSNMMTPRSPREAAHTPSAVRPPLLETHRTPRSASAK